MSDDDGALVPDSPDPKEETRDGWDRGRAIGKRIGGKAGAAVAGTIAAVMMAFGGLLMKIIPYGGRFWKGLAVRSIEKYHRRVGGDAVGLLHKPNGHIKLEAVKWTEGDPEEEKRPGWQASGRDKTWTASADGREVDRLGKAPVVLLDESANHRATVVEARVAEALDMGEYQPLYESDRIEVDATVEPQVDPSAMDADGSAVADGGHSGWQIDDIRIGDVVDNDAIVDISPEDDHDGQHVSLRKVKETYRHKSDAETMENVKTAAFLAGRANTDMKSFVIKVMLVGAGLAMLGLVGPELVSALFGGGGGGGGSTIGLSISPWLGW